MGRYIDLLEKGGESESKPIDIRITATQQDRIEHWKLSKNYFDGTREQGYGGYYYDGRWVKVAENIVKKYALGPRSKILDIGCAKGFLLHDIKKLLPDADVWGLDISPYALSQAPQDVSINLILGNASSLPFENQVFDFIFCNNSLHNILNINSTIDSLREISRVGKSSWISVAAYSNESEKKRIDDWAVVATTYTSESDWLQIFTNAGYHNDYYWFKP